MKRRSPWLAFAACALLNGTMVAEPAPSPVERPQTAPATANRPTLALSKAASAVEAELEKRGLAKDHIVSSISLVSGKDGKSYYIAQVNPLIRIRTVNAPADSPVSASPAKLVLQVEMDGQVTSTQSDPNRKRVRVIKTN